MSVWSAITACCASNCGEHCGTYTIRLCICSLGISTLVLLEVVHMGVELYRCTMKPDSNCPLPRWSGDKHGTGGVRFFSIAHFMPDDRVATGQSHRMIFMIFTRLLSYVCVAERLVGTNQEHIRIRCRQYDLHMTYTECSTMLYS